MERYLLDEQVGCAYNSSFDIAWEYHKECAQQGH